MIQVIPFTTEEEPLYLPLLARGLSDLSALRFNAFEISAQVNLDLKLEQWEMAAEALSAVSFALDGPELWFSGKLSGNTELTMLFVVFNPQTQRVVYQDLFQAPEQRFLAVWEEHLQGLIQRFEQPKEAEEPAATRRMFTNSLEAFLAFRKGLEMLSQASNNRAREEGLENLLKAVAFDPEFVEAADILLLFLTQNNLAENYDFSINFLERLRQIVDHHPRIPLVLAEVYYQLGNEEKTEEILRELVELFPDFIEGQIRFALFYHATERPHEALTVLEETLRRSPGETSVLDLLGMISAGIGELEKAEAYWLQTLEIEPDKVNVINNLALLAEETDEFEKAENYYKQAIQLNDTWWGTFANYGSFCRRKDRFEEALIWLEKAAELNPLHYNSLHDLALTQLELGHYAEAQESLLKLLQMASDNSVRRQILQLLSKLDDAEIKIELRIRQLERIWETGRKPKTVFALLGMVFKARSHWYYWHVLSKISLAKKWQGSAVLCWKMGLRYKPGFPLLKAAGMYFWEKKQFKRALPLLRQAYQLNSSDQDTGRAYFQTLIDLGEVEELHVNMKELSKFKNISF